MSFDLAWIERDLRALDGAGGELCAAAMFVDERPPQGLLALADFRLAGKLSRLCLSGFLTGVAGEKALVPVRPRFPYEKLLVVGLGPRAGFDEAGYRVAIGWILEALEGLRVRRAAIDLPGRHAGTVAASRAIELLDEAISARPACLDGVSIVDDREGQRAVEAWKVRPGRRNLAARR